MRILACTDIHGEEQCIAKIKAKIKKYKPEILLCAGDITFFNQNMAKVVKWLDSLGIPGYIIHGNHDQETTLEKLIKKTKHLKFVHEKCFQIKDVTLIGWGGGGFSTRDREFEAWIKANEPTIAKLKNLILMTHAPPRNTTLDNAHGSHVGCESFVTFAKKFKNTILGLAGHIHEGFLAHDRVGKTVFYNPGPYGSIIEIKDKEISIRKE